MWTLTTNVSMTPCNWQIGKLANHQTHVLCGCTTFGTNLKLGTKLIRSLRLPWLGQGRGYYKGGGGVPVPWGHTLGDVPSTPAAVQIRAGPYESTVAPRRTPGNVAPPPFPQVLFPRWGPLRRQG